MEKKMKITSSNSRMISVLTLTVTLIAGLLSNFLLFSFVPLLGGVIAVLGHVYQKRSRINVGMAIAIVSFFLLNYNLSFTLINLSIVLTVFISMMVLWAFARHNLMTAEIKSDMDFDKNNRYLKEFEHKSTTKLTKKMILAFILAFFGSFIALSSYTGTLLIRSLAVPLAVFFAGVFLFVIYVVTVLLPQYSEEENQDE